MWRMFEHLPSQTDRSLVSEHKQQQDRVWPPPSLTLPCRLQHRHMEQEWGQRERETYQTNRVKWDLMEVHYVYRDRETDRWRKERTTIDIYIYITPICVNNSLFANTLHTFCEKLQKNNPKWNMQHKLSFTFRKMNQNERMGEAKSLLISAAALLFLFIHLYFSQQNLFPLIALSPLLLPLFLNLLRVIEGERCCTEHSAVVSIPAWSF